MVYGVLSFFSEPTNLSTSGILLVGAGVGGVVFGAVFGVLFMGGIVFGDGRPPDALVVPSCAAIFIAAAVLAGVLRLAIAARSIFATAAALCAPGEAPKTLVPFFIGILVSFTSSWTYRLRSVRWR